MAFTLPELPFAKDALAPHISAETLDYHYGKHHQAYVTNLNGLVQGTALEKHSLEDLIRTQTGGVYNNAAQVWNHTFYWNCMKPKGGGEPQGALADAIANTFGGVAAFKEQFGKAAATLFGSGWVWLAWSDERKLVIEQSSNAGNPLREGRIPLLTCDVWEHAYYVDYRNARPKYVDAWWHLVNWDFVAKNFAGR